MEEQLHVLSQVHLRNLSAVPATAYNGKAWLDHVHGCACCLSHTGYVSECYLKARGCCSSTYLDACCAGATEEGTVSGRHMLADLNSKTWLMIDA